MSEEIENGEIENAIDENEENKNGTVEIKEGQVIIKDPVEGAQKARISPGNNVDIYVEGEKIENETEVGEQNTVQLSPEKIPPEYDIKVRVDKDKMHAYISIDIKQGRSYYVEDFGPSDKLKISADNYKEISLESVPTEEINKKLTEKGIVYGIDKLAVIRAAAAPGEEEILVAEGIYSRPGEDAYIENCCDKKHDVENEKLWVDNLNYGKIFSVDPGTLIARKIPLKKGEPGFNIYGEKTEPPEPRDIELKAGEGIELDEEGLEAYAVIGGSPVIKKDGLVSISSVYTFNRDLDKNTGNIYFKGDIVVKGSILDGRKVKAAGSVTVDGFATHCTVEARGEIKIAKNVVGSTLKAGGKNVYLYPIRDSLNILIDYINQLDNALHQLAGDKRFKDRPEVKKYGEGILLKILLDTKFSYVAGKFKGLLEEIKSLGNEAQTIMGVDFMKNIKNVENMIVGRGPMEIKSLEEFYNLSEAFEKAASEALEKIGTTLQAKSPVIMGYVQHSSVEASGDVKITGRGAYNVDIYSGGNVIVEAKNGFFRGGKILAKGDVEIYELGSPGGAVTYIEVPEDKEIKTVVTHPGVTIKTGAVKKEIGAKADGGEY